MTTIAAVVFDVGNVLVEWDPRHLYRKLFNGDDTAMERFIAEVCSLTWNARQDAGRPFTEAVAELAAAFPHHAPLIAAYDARWEEMVPHAHDGTIAIVRELAARRMPLYCLTNFSAEKFPIVRRRFDVFALFDGIVVSGEIGLIKPDPAIYRHLLDRFGLHAGLCLFIDDSPANVAAARATGMPAIIYRGAEALRAELVRHGIL